ncbi:MAG: hypothetical protein JST27_04315, partial [Bacteroidetes bacterium]|nr:hypothetical protein [Bacteroidota bacterium]
LDIHTPKFIVESDATIVAPLIFAYLWLVIVRFRSKGRQAHVVIPRFGFSQLQVFTGKASDPAFRFVFKHFFP